MKPLISVFPISTTLEGNIATHNLFQWQKITMKRRDYSPIILWITFVQLLSMKQNSSKSFRENLAVCSCRLYSHLTIYSIIRWYSRLCFNDITSSCLCNDASHQNQNPYHTLRPLVKYSVSVSRKQGLRMNNWYICQRSFIDIWSTREVWRTRKMPNFPCASYIAERTNDVWTNCFITFQFFFLKGICLLTSWACLIGIWSTLTQLNLIRQIY